MAPGRVRLTTWATRPTSIRANAYSQATLDADKLFLSMSTYLDSRSSAGDDAHISMETTIDFLMPADEVLWDYRLSQGARPYSTGTILATLTDLTDLQLLYSWSTSVISQTKTFRSTRGHLLRLRIQIAGDQNTPVTMDTTAWWETEVQFAIQAVDCNENGVYDPSDISSGFSTDFDHNGLPDDCDSSVIYVNQNSAPGGDGTGWATAFQSLDDALEVARTRDDQVIPIWIAEGTYVPKHRIIEGDSRSATFSLPPHVYLHGGFAGVESSLPNRNMALHPTILTGDLAGNDGPAFTNRHDNAYHVLQTDDVRSEKFLLLDSVVVRGGFADASEFNFGAGLKAFGTVVLQNCTFEDNWGAPAKFDGTVAHSNGGGAVAVFGDIYHDDSGKFDAVWENCTFTNNVSSGTGGAVFLAGISIEFDNCLFEGNLGSSAGAMGYESLSSLAFRNCNFISNVSEYGGGAISAFYHIFDFSIDHCQFQDNKGGNGGALFIGDGAERFAISNCLFQGNSSGYDGGAIYWPGQHHLTLDITDSEFYENDAEESGGALSAYKNAVVISRSTFWRNEANQGGAIFGSEQQIFLNDCVIQGNEAIVGGGLGAGFSSTVYAYRCSFEDNSATVGGAASATGGEVFFHFLNSLLVYNSADLYGGAISGGAGQTEVAKCTLVGNSSYGLGAAVFSGTNTTVDDSILWRNENFSEQVLTAEQAQIEGAPTINHSIVQGWTGALGGEGNSGSDPLILEWVLEPYAWPRNFQLSLLSPAINAGDPDYAGLGGSTDMDGHARVLCGRVDMGAYESGIGDFDCDGAVGLVDIAGWVACAEGSSEGSDCAAMDFDNDGDFDLKDFAGMQQTIGE